MKYLRTIAVAAGLACTAATSRADMELDFSSTANSQIVFTKAGLFSFANTKKKDELSITGSSTAAHDSLGDLGDITGSFQIGAEVGTSDQYTVTGGGQMIIKDGVKTYTGNLVWDTIGTGGKSTTGGLNLNGTLNLTSVSYGGTQLDLQALMAAGLAEETVSFQFSSAKTVPQLFGTTAKSFSGSIFTTSSVPEPTTVIAGALLLLPFGISTLRALRRDRSAAPLA